MKARSQAAIRRESSAFQQDSEKSSNAVLKGEVSRRETENPNFYPHLRVLAAYCDGQFPQWCVLEFEHSELDGEAIIGLCPRGLTRILLHENDTKTWRRRVVQEKVACIVCFRGSIGSYSWNDRDGDAVVSLALSFGDRDRDSRKYAEVSRQAQARTHERLGGLIDKQPSGLKVEVLARFGIVDRHDAKCRKRGVWASAYHRLRAGTAGTRCLLVSIAGSHLLVGDCYGVLGRPRSIAAAHEQRCGG